MTMTAIVKFMNKRIVKIIEKKIACADRVQMMNQRYRNNEEIRHNSVADYKYTHSLPDSCGLSVCVCVCIRI